MEERYLGELPEKERSDLGIAVRNLRACYETIYGTLVGGLGDKAVEGYEDILTILNRYATHGDIEETMDALQHSNPDAILETFSVIGITQDELRKEGYLQ